MKFENRQQILIIGAIAIVALFAADKILIGPLTDLWKSRSKHIVELRKQVEEGRLLLNREHSLQARWDNMRTNTLPRNQSVAEQQVINALYDWAQDSRSSITAVNSQWKRDTEDFVTLECRVDASGNLPALSRFLYDIEKDPMALKLETIELSAKDNEGQVLTMSLQLSGLVLGSQIQ